MEVFSRITGMSTAIPNVGTMDIRFALEVENGEPLLCVANNKVTAQIAHGLGQTLRMLNTALAFQGSNEIAPDPLSDQEALAGWKRNAVQMGLVVLSLQDFATRIVRHVLRGGTLDDVGIASIKDACIRNLKNIDAEGMSMNQEAETFGKAIENLQQFMNHIIAKGRDLNQV
jgi:hypothetical protein